MPGVAPAGTVCGAPCIHVDVFPTLIEIAHATRPANQPLDGVSLVPVIRSPSSSLDRDAIFQHFPGYLGAGAGAYRTTPVSIIQSGDWKLMEFLEDNRVELYHLGEDLGETKNLAQAKPEKAQELLDKLHAWRSDIGAPMPAKNTPSKQPKAGESKKKRKKAK